jgi:hypothetical protein
VGTRCGRVWLARQKIGFRQAFAGQVVAVKEMQDGIWRVRLWIVI